MATALAMHVLIFFWCPDFVAHRCAVIVSVFLSCVIPSVALRFLLARFLSAGYLSPSDKIVDCFGDSVSLFTGLLLISGIWRLTYSFVVQLS